MKKFSLWKLIALMLFAFSCRFVSAQIAPHMVNAPDAPVNLVSITSTLDDFLSVVTTKNVSDKVVRSFQLGVIMSVPQACGPTEIFGGEQVMRIDRVDLSPEVSVQTEKYELSPSKVNAFRLKYHADQVHTQLAVVRVDFADGTNWSINRTQPIYDREIMSRDAEAQCSKSAQSILLRSK